MIKVAALAVEIRRVGQPEKVKKDLRDIDRHGKQASASIIRLGTMLKTVFAAAGIGVGIATLVRGVRAAGGAIMDFDAAMTQSLAIMGDVSEAMREDMATAAQLVARTTTHSAEQAAQSYFYLASAGLDAAASLQALPVVSKFAQAGMFDMALATDLLTDAQSALGLTIRDDAVANMENMLRVSDVLVKANTIANATVQQFSEALTHKAGPALKIVNKSIEEGVAVLAAFADQGIKGAEAGTALNIVMRELQTKAIRNADAFKEMGVAVYDDNDKMRNMADIIEDLEVRLAGMSDQQKKATLMTLGFADKSVIFIQTLIGQSAAIRGYEADLRNAAGTTDEIANKQLEDFKNQINLTKGAIVSLLITINTFIQDAFDMAGGIADVRVELEGMEQAMIANRQEVTMWMRGFAALWQTGIVLPVRTAFNLIQLFFGAIAKTIIDLLTFVAQGLNTIAAAVNPILEFLHSPIRVMTVDIEKMGMVSDLIAYGMERDLNDIKDAVEGAAEAWAMFALAQEGSFPRRAPRRPPGGRDRPDGEEVPGGGGGVKGEYRTRAEWGLGKGEWQKDLDSFTKDLMGSVEQAAWMIEAGIGQTLGDAITSGFKTAFDADSIEGFMKGFGQALLGGFGDILVQLGRTLISYGITLTGLKPLLMNIFTAGPAAIAAGVAIMALGSAFTNIASGGGAPAGSTGGVGPAGGGFRPPAFPTDLGSREVITFGASAAPVQARATYNFTVIGSNDPRAQRDIVKLIEKAGHRGISA